MTVPNEEVDEQDSINLGLTHEPISEEESRMIKQHQSDFFMRLLQKLFSYTERKLPHISYEYN